MDNNLIELREQIAKKARLEAVLSELNSQKEELEIKARELKTVMIDEDNDVKRLEKPSLSALFFSAIGKREKKLEKERREACAARLKYDTAAAELEDVTYRSENAKKELKQLGGCELKYKNALKQKSDTLKALGGNIADKIIELEEKALSVAKNINELKEAIDAGQKAKSIAAEVEDKLEYARHMATRDLIGGGMLTHISKHDALDAAQNLVECFQIQLRSFKTELADVSIHADFQVNVEGFLRTADWFFDGIFVDLEVKERIENAQNEIANTSSRLSEALRNLDTVLNDNLREADAINKELENLTVNAEL